MTNPNGAKQTPDNDTNEDTDDFDPREYDTMLELERLESLEEDMTDLGVTTLDELRRRIADLHEQLGDE